ncbi:hypothetical protein A8F94_13840 [Bacillus sp. FJAT-27225]|nr:hypothetical protein A8F94_13840 [Bacillus sp. FJAT-27225]
MRTEFVAASLVVFLFTDFHVIATQGENYIKKAFSLTIFLFRFTIISNTRYFNFNIIVLFL